MSLNNISIGEATQTRKTLAAFRGMMMKRVTREKYMPLTRIVQAPEGRVDIHDVYPVGTMEDAKAGQQAKVWTMGEALYTIRTKPRRVTYGLDYETWRKAEAITDGDVNRALQASVGQISFDRHQRTANLLKEGTTNTSVFVTAAGGTTKSAVFTTSPQYIPETSKSFITRLEGSYTDDAAEVAAGIEAAISSLVAQQSVIGYMTLPPEDGGQFIVYYPPALRKKMQDAFNTAPGQTTVGIGQKYNGAVKMVEDPELAAANGGSDTIFYVAVADDLYAPFIYAERGPEEFRTTARNERGGEAYRILFNGELWQPYYAAGLDYGAVYNLRQVVNT